MSSRSFTGRALTNRILLVGDPAVESRQADDPGQAEPVANAVDPDTVLFQLAASSVATRAGAVGRLQRQDSPPVMLQA